MWWMMVAISTLMGVAVADEEVLSCEDARMRCVLRNGCGLALTNYMVGCSAVLQDNNPTDCPEVCHNSLIALTSTVEGQALMKCRCSDDFCVDAKKRVEICRPNVTLANQDGTIVSCMVAQFICAADNECSTALYYYNRHCKSMFHGKKCTHRCNNSISILLRQEKATKLKHCKCDGREEYNCSRIQENIKSLCFKDRRKQGHQHHHHDRHPHTTSTSPRTPKTRVELQQPPVRQVPVVTAVDIIEDSNRVEEEVPRRKSGSASVKSSVCALLLGLVLAAG